MVCIHKRTVFSQHVTHSLAFLVHLTVLSVGGVCVRMKRRRGEKEKSEGVRNGS